MESEKLAKKFPPIQLYNLRTGKANLRYICVYTALKNIIVNIKDINEFRKKLL